MVIRISDKTQNYSKVTKLLVKPFFNEHFVLNENESMFLDQFKQKNYMPELLYDGDELKRIKNHPMALWKTRTTKKL